MDNKKFWYIETINRGFSDSPSDSLFTLYRILRLRDAGFASKDPEALYLAAQNIRLSKNYQGDVNSFYRTFEIIKDFTEEECFDYVDYIFKNSRKEFVLVPQRLANLMLEKTTLSEKKIYIPDVEKFSSMIFTIIKKYPSTSIFTSCINKDFEEVFKYLFKNYGLNFIEPNYLEPEFTNARFDVVFCFPVMGGRDLIRKNEYISREPAFAATQNLLYHLSMEGKLIIVLPAKVSFGGGNIETLRTYLTTHYKITEIDSLPNKTFDDISINTYLMTIGNGQTEDVVIKKYEYDKNNDCLALVSDSLLFMDELESDSGWNIEGAFIQDDEDLSSFRNSSVRKNILQDVAKVFRGKAITQKAENGPVLVVNISNITETGIDYASLDSIDEPESKLDRYILEEGDVLITSRGTTIKTAVFKEQEKPCIASSNINVVRTNPKVLLGTYLKLFLDSPAGAKMLKMLQRGETIVNINYQDILTLDVPTPSLEEQSSIIREYETGLEMYKKTIEAAEEAWKGIQGKIKKNLY
ncbi:MAG: restriction endonuclease subunit S [Mollicutes bacterium]|nr:restriction endonuclease subunit S [Mollicutes bacterium]